MVEMPAVELNPENAVRIIEEHWPLAADGTPLLPADPDQPVPLLTDEEWEAWKRMRAEDKAWQLANWGRWCQEIDNLFK